MLRRDCRRYFGGLGCSMIVEQPRFFVVGGDGGRVDGLRMVRKASKIVRN